MTCLCRTRVKPAAGIATSPGWKTGRWVTTQWMMDSFRPESNLNARFFVIKILHLNIEKDAELHER